MKHHTRFSNTLKVMLMAAAISIGFTPESLQLLRAWDGIGERVGKELAGAFDQFITEVESSVQANELSGQEVGVRSGNLRQAVTGEVDGPLSGFVGTTEGATTPYARAILGPETTTIRPKNARHLWVPIADNLNPSGIAKHTPKGLFDTFGEDRIKIFTSKAGNTVVFVEDQKNEDGSKSRYKRNVFNRKDGSTKIKGQLKGKLMFVLKDEVVIQGTNALAKGTERMLPRGQQLLNDAIQRALPGGSGPGGGA